MTRYDLQYVNGTYLLAVLKTDRPFKEKLTTDFFNVEFRGESKNISYLLSSNDKKWEGLVSDVIQRCYVY